MVTPDYQEFANRADIEYRYNTVICRTLASRECRNQPSVARLPRCPAGTKAELFAQTGTEVSLAAIFADCRRR
jgi:hypothetical protein